MARQDARFTPVDDAEFTLVSDEATFELVTPESEARDTEREEQSVQEMLEREGIASAEAAFLAGTRQYVISSNVSWIEYHWVNADQSPLELLYVGFKDGSVYEYEAVPLDVARNFYHASSYGKFLWNAIRVRGTVFGTQYNYRLVAGSRIWFDAGSDSRARHEAIPKSGEPFEGYHPSMNWKGAKGAMGAKGGGVNLNKRGGSKKVAAFLPAQVKFGNFPPTGPFK